MKKYFSICIITVFLYACEKGGNCFQKGGNYITESRDSTSFFQAIRIYDQIDLEFTTGHTNSIEVNAPKNLQDLVYTTVDTTLLTIRNKNSCKWLGKYDENYKVKANMPNIYSLEILGANSVISKDTIFTSYFKVYLETASGDLDLKINNEIFAYNDFSGVCKSKIEGKTKVFILDTKGNATKHFEKFSSQKAIIVQSGATDVYLGATDTIDATIKHTGNIYYTGNPVIVKNQSISSGKLIKY